MIFPRDMHMRNLLTEFAIVLLAATVPPAATAAPADTAEFKSLIQNYWKAWSTLNPDNAAPMYSKDADAVFFDVAPLKYNGWDEYKEGVKKVFGGAASASFVPNDDLKVTRRGNIAWTSNTFHGTINQKDGKVMQLDGRHTVIWEKRAGHWIILHEHVSAPLP
jgi:ketosteroid isomerase-like protein